jgi:hypothetical protein
MHKCASVHLLILGKVFCTMEPSSNQGYLWTLQRRYQHYWNFREIQTKLTIF